MKDVANCPRCGKIFVKALRPMCQPCFKEQEDNFDKVSKFMRQKQNRMASLREVHEQTGVALEQIQMFVREGRLLATQFPNLGYPCESCGAIIRQGRLCEGCKGTITEGLDQIQKEKDFEDRKSAEEKKRMSTYHSSLNNRFDKK